MLATGAIFAFAVPCGAQDLLPEFSSKVYIDKDTEVGSVFLNDKEIVTFKAPVGTGTAADQADDLAVRLDELVSSKNFDANQLLPAREGDRAAVRVSGTTALTFGALNSTAKDPGAGALDASLKLVNNIRVSMGAHALPANFLDLGCAKLANAGNIFSGKASWYGPHFHGKKTSDGHRFDQDGMTAAHRSLPFGTKLLVLNRRTGDTCVVEVNDRGPFVDNRVLDLSRGAARRLNMIGSGVAMVDCLVLGTTSSSN
jgi:rare lipoprotein A